MDLETLDLKCFSFFRVEKGWTETCILCAASNSKSSKVCPIECLRSHKAAFLSPCNFVTTHSTAFILHFDYLPLSEKLEKASTLIRLPLPQCFWPRGRKLRPWSEKNSDQNPDHARLWFYQEKEKLRPWSEFLGRGNSDHGLSLRCFWGRGRRGGSRRLELSISKNTPHRRWGQGPGSVDPRFPAGLPFPVPGDVCVALFQQQQPQLGPAQMWYSWSRVHAKRVALCEGRVSAF